MLDLLSVYCFVMGDDFCMKLVKLANLELGELVSMDSWFGAAFHDSRL